MIKWYSVENVPVLHYQYSGALSDTLRNIELWVNTIVILVIQFQMNKTKLYNITFSKANRTEYES